MAAYAQEKVQGLPDNHRIRILVTIFASAMGCIQRPNELHCNKIGQLQSQK